MTVNIGVLAETAPGERRLSLVPDLVRRYAEKGARIVMQRGAGSRTHLPDSFFDAAGEIDFVDTGPEVAAAADVLLCVQPPSAKVTGAMRAGASLVGMLHPWSDVARVKRWLGSDIHVFALELLPRITRSQSMDVLSSQATVAGYECALIAADHCPKFFPMLTYAAGTIRPAKVLVIGAGVAGLQAIATARRLGAAVSAYDVRPDTREQVESLGARFVDTGVEAAGEGGYARELSDDERARQAERLAAAIAECDALITTAAIPGRAAPRIVTAAMVAAMKPGAVVVDMAAESGGNVEGVVAGDKVWCGEVLLIGPSHIPSRMPMHASEMYARNLFNFVSPAIVDGAWQPDWDDEVFAGTCLLSRGKLRHHGVARALDLPVED